MPGTDQSSSTSPSKQWPPADRRKALPCSPEENAAFCANYMAVATYFPEMDPRFKPGDMAIIHRTIPARRGDYALVYFNDDRTALRYVEKLSDDFVTLVTHAPETEVIYQRGQIRDMRPVHWQELCRSVDEMAEIMEVIHIDA